MEVPPTRDNGPDGGAEGPSGPGSGAEGPSGPWSGAEELDWRLAGVEGRLDAISERVERLESTIRSSVADEVRTATDDLRRTITQLGRLLVKDLPHELARHRDAIVAELRPPPPPEPEPEPEPAPAPEPVVLEAEDPEEAVEAEVATVPPSPDAAERRRASRLRRRHG
jgi:hypothetical protein